MFIIDYDYDFYGYSNYRGGYNNESYYDEYYQSFDGDYYFDYSRSGAASHGGGGGQQRPGRSSSVGFK